MILFMAKGLKLTRWGEMVTHHPRAEIFQRETDLGLRFMVEIEKFRSRPLVGGWAPPSPSREFK